MAAYESSVSEDQKEGSWCVVVFMQTSGDAAKGDGVNEIGAQGPAVAVEKGLKTVPLSLGHKKRIAKIKAMKAQS